MQAQAQLGALTVYCTVFLFLWVALLGALPWSAHAIYSAAVPVGGTTGCTAYMLCILYVKVRARMLRLPQMKPLLVLQ